MAIAGIQQGAFNPLGVNSQQNNIDQRSTQVLAAVAPIEKTSRSEDTSLGIAAHSDLDIRIADTRFEFSVHEGTEKIMVKVIDERTDEIIREIPPEEILNMVAKIWELAGILVDKRV